MSGPLDPFAELKRTAAALIPRVGVPAVREAIRQLADLYMVDVEELAEEL